MLLPHSISGARDRSGGMTHFTLSSTERESLERLRSENKHASVFPNITDHPPIPEVVAGASKAELSRALGCSISTIDRAPAESTVAMVLLVCSPTSRQDDPRGPLPSSGLPWSQQSKHLPNRWVMASAPGTCRAPFFPLEEDRQDQLQQQ